MVELRNVINDAAEDTTLDTGDVLLGRKSDDTLARYPASLLDARYVGVSLAAYGLDGATTNIAAVIAAAVADGQRHLIVPYDTDPWPATSTISLTGVWLEFEPGARISFDHAGQGMDLTNSRLTRASFTSIHTGPASASDATDPLYGFPAREVELNDGCLIDGGYYHEYATNGLHVVGADCVLDGLLQFANIRHQQGWAAAIHFDGTGCKDITVPGRVIIDSCDRGIECEEGASNVCFSGGGHLTDVSPAGYTGQGSAASYATYTFVLDAHAHENAGGPVGIMYGGSWVVENCGGGVTFVRSTGTNDSDLPVNCGVGDVRIIGRDLSTGYADIAIQGRGHRIGRVHFDAGDGVATTDFNVLGYADSEDNHVGSITWESGTSVVVADDSNGLFVGGFPISLQQSRRTGKFLSLPQRPVTTATLTNGTARTVPIMFPVDVTVDQLGVEVTATGDVGATFRIGVWEDLEGLPGDPLVDVSVAANATGVVMGDISDFTFKARNWYHVGGAVQNVTVSQPTFRVTITPNDEYPLFQAAAPTSTSPVGYSKGGVTGALAAWGTTISTSNVVARVHARVA